MLVCLVLYTFDWLSKHFLHTSQTNLQLVCSFWCRLSRALFSKLLLHPGWSQRKALAGRAGSSAVADMRPEAGSVGRRTPPAGAATAAAGAVACPEEEAWAAEAAGTVAGTVAVAFAGGVAAVAGEVVTTVALAGRVGAGS